jgi:hypothetical protein
MMESGENLATIKAKTLNKGGINFSDVVKNTNKKNAQESKNKRRFS